MVSPQEIIETLYDSQLYAQCPQCQESFLLSTSVIFDGTKEFPEEAKPTKETMENELVEQLSSLKKRQERASTGAEKTSVAVNIGKTLEKILPTLKGFKMAINDCRFLADPIDMIVFEGATELKIKKITFMDVKTGKARLQPNQKAIKDAIQDHKLKFEVI